MQSYETLSAFELAKGLGEGRWSSFELTQYFLSRISKINPILQAIPIVNEEEALKSAEASDKRRQIGQRLSPLDGIPMTIKDSFRVKGMRSTYGMFLFRRHQPKKDCLIVQALRESGLVFLGRSAVPTGALDWNCKNQIHPECVNPYHPAYVPGGSSGGAAAALSAGLTPIEMGSDLGGSIRYPAHCCGVYGLRTTDGWWPIHDLGPESVGTSFQRLVTCGPMTRTLEDIELMLSVFERFFPMINKQKKEKKSSLRIACSLRMLGIEPDESSKRLILDVLDHLKKSGHMVIEALPHLDEEELYRDWGTLAGFEYSSVIPKLFRNKWLNSIYGEMVLRRLGSGPLKTYFKQGMVASQSQYENAVLRREHVFQVVDQFFNKFDLLILPVAPSSAIPRELCGQAFSSDQGDLEYSRYLGAYTVPTTMYGTPVLTCPIGNDRNQLPIGIQIHGARYSDFNLVQTISELVSRNQIPLPHLKRSLDY